jgi:hypothetical protein
VTCFKDNPCYEKSTIVIVKRNIAQKTERKNRSNTLFRCSENTNVEILSMELRMNKNNSFTC